MHISILLVLLRAQKHWLTMTTGVYSVLHASNSMGTICHFEIRRQSPWTSILFNLHDKVVAIAREEIANLEVACVSKKGQGSDASS